MVFECPHCRYRFNVNTAFAVKSGACPKCHNAVTISTPDPPAPSTEKPRFDPKNLRPYQIVLLVLVGGPVIFVFIGIPAASLADHPFLLWFAVFFIISLIGGAAFWYRLRRSITAGVKDALADDLIAKEKLIEARELELRQRELALIKKQEKNH